jgi:hypothetical protein
MDSKLDEKNVARLSVVTNWLKKPDVVAIMSAKGGWRSREMYLSSQYSPDMEMSETLFFRLVSMTGLFNKIERRNGNYYVPKRKKERIFTPLELRLKESLRDLLEDPDDRCDNCGSPYTTCMTLDNLVCICDKCAAGRLDVAYYSNADAKRRALALLREIE